MNKISLSSKLTADRFVSSKYGQYLQNLNIHTILDLLNYYPYRYEDYSHAISINQITADHHFHLKATVVQVSTHQSFRKRINMTTVTVEDSTGTIKFVWFNNRYINKYLKKGQEYIFFVKARQDKYGLSITNPLFYLAHSAPPHFIIPIYSETKAIKSSWFSAKVAKIISLADEIIDTLPSEIISQNKLISLSLAIKQIHQPSSAKQIKQAIQRLAFNEIFFLQLKNFYHHQLQSQQAAYPIEQNIDYIKNVITKLPYQLTNYQKKALWEIIQDLSSNKPTNRLLEGDVGSGKTIVALIACLLVASQDKQAVIIAPTEILAIQHFSTAVKLFANSNITFCLFTGSKFQYHRQSVIVKSKRENIIKKIEKNTIQIIIATHAIWHHQINYHQLALVVIDEQHRFGVEQRNSLSNQSATKPHIITMSATPIPRTLALSVYGHLDISQIRCRPAGRKNIITNIVHPNTRNQTYDFIKKQLSLGRQAYVICPLIEESEKTNLKSVVSEYEKLIHIFSDYQVALLHGALKHSAKEEIMNQFSQNKIQILVSTSVIEVGIDVPNANIIVIEGSDRFGLAQLHQFRGRVGRGSYQSYCFLFTDLPSQKVLQRLRVLVETTDGFKIAEADLKLRGPGELSGIRQSGIPDLKMASLSDQVLIQASLQAVKDLLASDPDLSKHVALKKQILQQHTNLS